MSLGDGKCSRCPSDSVNLVNGISGKIACPHTGRTAGHRWQKREEERPARPRNGKSGNARSNSQRRDLEGRRSRRRAVFFSYIFPSSLCHPSCKRAGGNRYPCRCHTMMKQKKSLSTHRRVPLITTSLLPRSSLSRSFP